MGGKALNGYGVFTERKNTEEFNQIGYELKVRLFFDLSLFSTVVKCYRTKPDHGDLDLLICIDQEFLDRKINLRKYIQDTFKPQAIHSNSGVISFNYKNFQIDFIQIKKEKWEIANVWYQFDPQANICGKTFHKFGLSYGWDGLFYKFRNFHGTLSKDILLTTNPRKIYEFGGYDYDRFLNGFDTLEDIFKFVIAGKYFETEMFQMENLKFIDRKRNKKRGSYHLFLNYLKENNINTKYNFKNKDEYLLMINDYFPEANLLEKLNVLKVEDTINKEVSEKFNGDIVMTWLPDLNGKELGNAMRKFRESYGEGYKNFILKSTILTIQSCFMEMLNNDHSKLF